MAPVHRPAPKLAMNLMAVMLGRKQYAAALVFTNVENPVTLIGGPPLVHSGGRHGLAILHLDQRRPVLTPDLAKGIAFGE
jgi:hypothetical protein